MVECSGKKYDIFPWIKGIKNVVECGGKKCDDKAPLSPPRQNLETTFKPDLCQSRKDVTFYHQHPK